MAKQSTRDARRAQHQPDIEVLDGPVTEDQRLVDGESTKLREFMGGMVRFFTGARKLETKSDDILGVAKRIKAPTTGDEDMAVQTVIRNAKLIRKEVDEFWTITAVVNNLHKKLVAGRERAGKKADEAAALGQGFHDRYVREAERKAREEQDRLRREEEQRAQAERDRELAELEAQAVAAEAKSPELSERETIFVANVISGRMPTESARLAHYANPEQSADRLMKTPKIVKAIEAARTAASIRQQKEAKAETPIDVDVPTVKADVQRPSGGYDRSTWSAAYDDREAFLMAALDPATRTKLGIPHDVLTIDEVKMNEYARGMKKQIDRWPGVHAHEKKSTV